MNALILLAAGAGLAFAWPAQTVAGGVVQSDEWKVRRSPEKEEEFIGDVRYRGGENSFSADWALLRHGPQLWRARGRVRIERRMESGDLLVATGDEGLYDQKTGEGSLTSQKAVELRRTPPEGDADFATARRLEWTGKERAVLSGEVHAWGPRLEAWSDRARYDGDQGALRLSGGRPVLRKLEPAPGGWTGAVKADEITAYRDGRRLLADGKALGWIEFPRQRRGGRPR